MLFCWLHVDNFHPVGWDSRTYWVCEHVCGLVIGTHLLESNKIVACQISVMVKFKSMRLLRSEMEWLIVSEMALMLSVYTMVGGIVGLLTIGTWLQYFQKNLRTQTICFRHEDAEMYAASAELKEMIDCLLDCQKMDASLRVTIMPEVDRRVSWHLAQSKSTNDFISECDWVENKSDLEFFCWRIEPPAWPRSGADWRSCAAALTISIRKNIYTVWWKLPGTGWTQRSNDIDDSPKVIVVLHLDDES